MITAMGGGLPGSGETITISINDTTATESATLTAGISYEMSSDIDFHYCRTATGVDDATTDDAPQRSNWTPKFFTATQDKLFVSAIGATASGTVWIVPCTANVRKDKE
jgi:hypothetical protein